MRDHETDVLVVGYGPVGQVTANLIAQRGWQVTVVEHHPQPYPMPRAVAFDGEAARILAMAGVSKHIAEFGEPSGDYLWRNSAGQELLYIAAPAAHGRNGWPDSTSMYQPGLEAALAERGSQLPGLRVFRGYDLVELDDIGTAIVAVMAGRDGTRASVRARWVVGCDGANSFVRQNIGGAMVDLGFRYDWLICDVVLKDDRVFVPNNLQICDPQRPRTEVSAGPGHRRWEFMLKPGEDRTRMDSPESAWKMLSLCGITPDVAIMERHAVYAFEASYAERWWSGRRLIAGDAAHLMPPFAGQGMSSGFRDAANLAWKLDLVLRGLAEPDLLATYESERRIHVQHAIRMSMDLGKVICQTDPRAAADRDAVMIAARKRNIGAAQPPFRPLASGFLAGGRGAGDQVPQPRVSRAGVFGGFDEVIGSDTFVLMSRVDPGDDPSPASALTHEHHAFLSKLGTRMVRLLPPDTDPAGPMDVVDVVDVVDVDGTFGTFLAERGARHALVRPDLYAFGLADDDDGLVALVDALRAQLSTPATLPG